MTTTVHLPPELLARVDERARALKISRNQYVRRALDRQLAGETEWSDRFRRALEDAAADEDGAQAVDQLMRSVGRRRSRKGPPAL